MQACTPGDIFKKSNITISKKFDNKHIMLKFFHLLNVTQTYIAFKGEKIILKVFCKKYS